MDVASKWYKRNVARSMDGDWRSVGVQVIRKSELVRQFSLTNEG
jgi:hypothetical protein